MDIYKKTKESELILCSGLEKETVLDVLGVDKIYGCAVSRLYVDSTTTTSCVTHSMLIGIETYSEVKLC